MLLYHHTKQCAAKDVIGNHMEVSGGGYQVSILIECIDGTPLFNVPKSIALDSIKDWRDDMEITFPVKGLKNDFMERNGCTDGSDSW